MKRIVGKYMRKQPLSPDELVVIRCYVYLWVNAMPAPPPGYERILEMTQEELWRYVPETLYQLGIRPF